MPRQSLPMRYRRRFFHTARFAARSALGTTAVNATATDEGGNASSCSFNVTVRDTTAPAITCPADQIAEASSAAGGAVTYAAAVATDAVSTTVISYSAASGSVFARRDAGDRDTAAGDR